MCFFGAAHRWGGQIDPSSLISVTHILRRWNLVHLYLPYKYLYLHLYLPINHVIHPLSSADISNFLPEIRKFYYIKKYRYNCIWYIISNSFNFFLVLKDFFNKKRYLRLWRHNFCLWHHQQKFITWVKFCCRCGHVTKVW